MKKIISIISKDERLRLKALADAQETQKIIDKKTAEYTQYIKAGMFDHIKPN
tara:strand:- start:148 stop:303 length:156 start_codon:yes stop_codon:yes gene_type:complete